jgi:hypothetical protein
MHRHPASNAQEQASKKQASNERATPETRKQPAPSQAGRTRKLGMKFQVFYML